MSTQTLDFNYLGPPRIQEIVAEMARWHEDKNTITQKMVDNYFGEKGRGSEEKKKITSGTGKRELRTTME